MHAQCNIAADAEARGVVGRLGAPMHGVGADSRNTTSKQWQPGFPMVPLISACYAIMDPCIKDAGVKLMHQQVPHASTGGVVPKEDAHVLGSLLLPAVNVVASHGWRYITRHPDRMG